MENLINLYSKFFSASNSKLIFLTIVVIVMLVLVIYLLYMVVASVQARRKLTAVHLPPIEDLDKKEDTKPVFKGLDNFKVDLVTSDSVPKDEVVKDKFFDVLARETGGFVPEKEPIVELPDIKEEAEEVEADTESTTESEGK